ncbi:MAG: DUF1385 domain-containing protein [Actinomycetota bacterium]|nr:DUF1385 domain-containing protein [Actinomycetota bacterium]
MTADKKPRPSIGGQAVLEGVMMRGPASWSVACRKPDETIAVEAHELPSTAQRHPWLKWPLFRGVMVLVESLSIGIRALKISANYALEEEEQLSDKQLGWSLGVAMVMFSAIFIVLPVLGTRLIENLVGDLSVERPLLFNIIEGSIRLGMFLGYLLLIGQFKDIRRVFQYHGAEHKTIYAYENGDELIPKEIDDKYPTLHVRCGTNFLFIVLFLTIIAHFLIDLFLSGPLIPRLAVRILAIPVLAGIGYEAIKLASRNEDSLVFRISMLPGLALQRITTKPPTLDQIEVAIAAMEAVAPDESERDDAAPDETDRGSDAAPEAPVA